MDHRGRKAHNGGVAVHAATRVTARLDRVGAALFLELRLHLPAHATVSVRSSTGMVEDECNKGVGGRRTPTERLIALSRSPKHVCNDAKRLS